MDLHPLERSGSGYNLYSQKYVQRLSSEGMADGEREQRQAKRVSSSNLERMCSVNGVKDTGKPDGQVGALNAQKEEHEAPTIKPVVSAHHSQSGPQKKRARPSSLLQAVCWQIEKILVGAMVLSILCIKLLGYLGLGYKWVTKLFWLILYTTVLLPGFIEGMHFYYLSGRVMRNIWYGRQARNCMDIYLPARTISKPRPVVVYVTGGAWIIGYKAWGALLGWALAEREVLVVCIDYRNFPQATVSHMVDDVTTAITWIFEHINLYGGDRDRVHLVGQSAGAQLAAMALLEEAKKEGKHESHTWRPSDIKAFIGISGGYNLVKIIDHLENRGLKRSIFLRIMEGMDGLVRYSPELVVRSEEYRKQRGQLPPMKLYHGTADISMPYFCSCQFADALRAAGVHNVQVTLLRAKTHTDLIIHDLMRGGKDELLEGILELVHGKDADESVKELAALPRLRMLPEILLKIARFASPF